MAKKKSEGQMVVCPVGKFFMELEDTFGKKTEFFEHLGKSRIEFLKAIRSLVDNQIDNLEKKASKKGKKKMTKIKVQ
jgi:hypothetical protein